MRFNKIIFLLSLLSKTVLATEISNFSQPSELTLVVTIINKNGHYRIKTDSNEIYFLKDIRKYFKDEELSLKNKKFKLTVILIKNCYDPLTRAPVVILKKRHDDKEINKDDIKKN